MGSKSKVKEGNLRKEEQVEGSQRMKLPFSFPMQHITMNIIMEI